MQTPGLLIFDLDGTLLDSMAGYTRIFGQALHEGYGFPPAFGEQVYRDTAGQPLDWQFARALELQGADPRGAKGLAARFWQLAPGLEAALFPEAAAVIAGLAQAGYTLALTSGSTQQTVNERMDRAGLSGYFSLMLGTDYDPPSAAKGEGHFRLLRQRLGLTPEAFSLNGALTGDAGYDMQIACKAGLLAIGRITGDNAPALHAAGAHFTIHSLDGLCALLKVGGVYQPVSRIKKRITNIANRAEWRE